jgi:hypothetical protein
VDILVGAVVCPAAITLEANTNASIATGVSDKILSILWVRIIHYPLSCNSAFKEIFYYMFK